MDIKINHPNYSDQRDNYGNGRTWIARILPLKYKYIAIHHTVTNPKYNIKKELKEVLEIHKARGWKGIGYNFIVSSEEVDGVAKFAYVGDLDYRRAHTPNRKGNLGIPKDQGNSYIIGISIVGRFDLGQKPTDAQLRACKLIIDQLTNEKDKLASLYNKSFEIVKKHKDFDYTACCGTWNLDDIKNVNDIDNNMSEPCQKLIDENKKLKSWLSDRDQEISQAKSDLSNLSDDNKTPILTWESMKKINSTVKNLRLENETLKVENKDLINQKKEINIKLEAKDNTIVKLENELKVNTSPVELNSSTKPAWQSKKVLITTIGIIAPLLSMYLSPDQLGQLEQIITILGGVLPASIYTIIQGLIDKSNVKSS